MSGGFDHASAIDACEGVAAKPLGFAGAVVSGGGSRLSVVNVPLEGAL